jgi:hypothetical protein
MTIEGNKRNIVYLQLLRVAPFTRASLTGE